MVNKSLIGTITAFILGALFFGAGLYFAIAASKLDKKVDEAKYGGYITLAVVFFFIALFFLFPVIFGVINIFI